MRMSRSKFVAAAAVGLVAAGGSAFTAANTTTPVTSAGQAVTSATGFAVSALDYVLAPGTDADGEELASVTFTLTATAGHNVASEARVQLVDGQAFYSCTAGAATGQAVPFTCLTDNLLVNSMNTLNIVAVSN